ncbi:hypothetical protein BU17DRAFT_72479 [Hysterangium stoloniferum]|nr:hypothetical protein BU17DRAFT_72479 [Hysterangium stoloniferum]
MVLNVIGDIFGAIISPIGLASFLSTPGLFSTTTESKHLNKIITSTMTMKPLAFTKPIGGPKWDHSDCLDTPIGVPVSHYFHFHLDIRRQHLKRSAFILHHYVLDTQFKVSDILTDMSISLGYQLPGFNRGFSPFMAAVTGFKLFANLKLNLEQVMGLFGWLPQCTASILKGNLATVLMSKPFGGRTQQRRARATRAACTHRGDDLSHPAVIGSACIALIHITLVLTLLGVIVYFAHSRLQKAHMTGTSKAPMRLITHPVNDSNVEGIDTADHAPAVDDGHIEGTNAADCLPAVDNGSVESTDADPDSTPRISREDKGKGVGLREYGPLMLDGSLFMGSLAQRIGQESSFIDDDDEATDRKVLACMSMQTDLSPAFALLPVVPFIHHIVSCQLNPPHVSASATTTAMDSEWINDHGCGEEVYADMSYRGIWGGSSSSTQIFPHTTGLGTMGLQDELMSSLDPVPRPKSSPPDFPDFKYQEITR